MNSSSSGSGGDQRDPLTNHAQRTFHNNLQQQQHQLQHFQAMLKQPPHQKGPKKLVTTTCEDPLQSTRQLLPILVCLLSFATVLSVLIIYMDTTEIRHQQFRLNMTRDYELVGVSQDDPELITYVRDIYLRRYANTFFPATGHQLAEPWDFRERQELAPRMAKYVVDELLQGKQRGVFVQSMPGQNERLMTAQWLAGGAGWTGMVVEPDLRKFFEFRKEMASHKGVEVIHACVSPNEYPKEVHVDRELEQEAEEAEVKINSLHEDDADGFELEAGRVKCFSLFTILLATNRTTVDLLSLGVKGHQLQILQTLPYDRVKISVISLHFVHGENTKAAVGTASEFLYEKGFEFVRKMENSYFYQAIAKEKSVEMARQLRVEKEAGV